MVAFSAFPGPGPRVAGQLQSRGPQPRVRSEIHSFRSILEIVAHPTNMSSHPGRVFPRMAWLQKEIPFELMGFGCDGLHELWDDIPHGGIPLDALSGALKEAGFERPKPAKTSNFFLDPWEYESIDQGTRNGDGQRHHGLGEQAGRLAGGRPPRPLHQRLVRRRRHGVDDNLLHCGPIANLQRNTPAEVVGKKSTGPIRLLPH